MLWPIGKIRKNKVFYGFSSIFMQKVPRYADEVFLLADYMVENFKYVNQLSFSQLENGSYFNLNVDNFV